MIDVAKHVRVFEKDPSDEFVQKRITAVGSIVEKFSKLSTVSDILGLANDAAVSLSIGSSMPDQRAAEIEALIKNESTAFVREEQELQIVTCALMALLQMIADATPSGGHWNKREVLAVGLWSALSFQPPRTESRLESLRLELLDASRSFVTRASIDARKRLSVQDIPAKAKDNATPIELADAIKSANKAIDTLRTNAALDREELDLLWWCLADWSSLLDKKLSDLPAVTAAITAGIEAGNLMRRIPAESHKHIVKRYVREELTLSLKEVLERLEAHRNTLIESFAGSSLLGSCSEVFPLMGALRSGIRNQHGSDLKLALSDWASRSLLESSLLRVSTLTTALV